MAQIWWNDKESCWEFKSVGTRFLEEYEDGLCEFIMKNKKKKSNKVIVRCEQCKEFFKIKIKTQNLNDGDYERYFECPLCKKKYSIGYFSNRVDAMISLKYSIESIREEQMVLKQKYEVQ